MVRLIALLLLFVLAFGVAAQDAQTVEGCEAVDWATALRTAADEVESGDTPLEIALWHIDLARAACDGLSWEGTTAQVLGPVEIEAGVYRVTADTEGYFIAKVVVVTGACEGTSSGALFNESAGRATGGTEKLFMVDEGGCKVLIEVDNISSPWSLVFERM